MDDELHFLEMSELARLLHARKVSPVELTRSMLARIERVDTRLHAFARVTPELALAQAKDAETMLMQRRILGPMHGVPIALKDLCYTKGIATAAGMPMHRDFVAASLDHIGPMCRSAAYAGAMLGIIAGADPRDCSASLEAVPDYLAGSDRELRGVRIGLDADYSSRGVDAATSIALKEAAEVLRALGAELRTVRFPDSAEAMADWPVACAVETAVAHEATFPSRRAEYGEGLAGFIDSGRSISALELQKVWLRRRTFSGRVAALFEQVELLLIPAQSKAAPTIAQMATLGSDPELFAALAKFAMPFNMTGSPTLTLPGGATREGRPVAVQLVARHFGEGLLVRAGRAFQRETDWHRRHPTLR